MNFAKLENFNVEIISDENSFEKTRVDKQNIVEILKFFKDNAFDSLNTIICIDLGKTENKFEIIYDLFSLKTCENKRISILTDRNSPHVPSIVGIYKSAYFDECEIFDMFGVIFDNNPDLKRLLMPKGWIGYPLRKDYVQDDKRLEWNNIKK